MREVCWIARRSGSILQPHFSIWQINSEKFVYIYVRMCLTKVVLYVLNSYCKQTSDDATDEHVCKFHNAIINNQILNSANIPTKSSSYTISYLLTLGATYTGWSRTDTQGHCKRWYMCTAVLPVQFLLITISCCMLEKELILGVFMCTMSRASSHVPSFLNACAQWTGHLPLSSWQQCSSASLSTESKKWKTGKVHSTIYSLGNKDNFSFSELSAVDL